MSGISKRVSGSWVSGNYGIMKTSTDTITTLPAVLYPNDTTATVGLKGNMEQNGTPTPENPIQPSECGDRTENLFDYTNPIDKINNKFINKSGTIDDSTFYYTSKLIVTPNTTYTWRFANTEIFNAPTVGFYDSADSLISVAGHGNNISYFSFTTPANCAYIRVSVFKNTDNEAMLNTGSTALPYQPYGYKAPISSASTTTPVYLGEVESTRRIKKVVLKGDDTETYTSSYSGNNRFFNYTLGIRGLNSLISTHFTIADISSTSTDVGIRILDNITLRIRPENVSGMTVDTFKAWLAQQYANGTPVTVWYVLATEETAVVNEPIRKIGDYADTVSGITIPTTAGADSLSVDTTVQPSEVTVNYKGWHPVADVHERENGAWT